MYFTSEVKTLLWNQSHGKFFFFFLVAVCGLGVAAKEVKDGFFKKRIVVKQG